MWGRKSFLRDAGRFWAANRGGGCLLLLFLLGAGTGCVLFLFTPGAFTPTLAPLLKPEMATGESADFWRVATGVAGPALIGLIGVFLLGLCAFSPPILATVPLLFGLGVGLSLTYYYSVGLRGAAYAAICYLPYTLGVLAALLIACAASAKLGAALCRQLLPQKGICGSLWGAFYAYLLRFLLCVGLVCLSGALGALIRVLLPTHLFV